MAHSNQARYARYQDHNMWFQKNVKHDSPAWDERRAERAVIEAELFEAEMAAHDPEVLLWGGSLATPKDVFRRITLRSKVSELWAMADYDWYDPYWDDRDYDYDRDEDFDYGSRYDRWCDDYLDPCDAAWVEEWVAGRVETPWDWREHTHEEYYDGLGEDGYDDWDDWDWPEPEPPDNLPGDLSEIRMRERARASARGRMRSARRR